MYELIQLSNKCYYIESPAKIGLVRLNDNDVCLIDSGNDKDAGRRIKKILDENKWNLTAIYNTHSNADHIGGNKYLQSQMGCRIFAKNIESAFSNYPILEPSFLFGGYPPRDLKHKFLYAAESRVENLLPEMLPENVVSVDLPGHFFDMTGFCVDDGVAYIADCLSSEETLNKYQIGFIYDIAAYIKTLESLKNMQAKIFVPAHAAVSDKEQILYLADLNIRKVKEIAQNILNICAEPMCFEHILQKLFEIYGLQMNFEQYVLVGSTVRSYLSWLKDTERLCVDFSENILLWKRI